MLTNRRGDYKVLRELAESEQAHLYITYAKLDIFDPPLPVAPHAIRGPHAYIQITCSFSHPLQTLIN